MALERINDNSINYSFAQVLANNADGMNEKKKSAAAENYSSERRDPRRRTFKAAIASYNDRAISMEVVIRDVSDSGVRIKLQTNDFLPNRFTLYIELDGVLVDCEAVWRRDMEIGAKFVSEKTNVRPLRSQIVNSTRLHKKTSIFKKIYAD